MGLIFEIVALFGYGAMVWGLYDVSPSLAKVVGGGLALCLGVLGAIPAAGRRGK